MRCGRCDEIFDASARLSQEVSDGSVVAQDSDPVQTQLPAPDALDPVAVTQASAAEILEPQQQAAPEPGAHDSAVANPSLPVEPGKPSQDDFDTDQPSDPTPATPWPDVSFMRRGRGDAFWHKPLTRIVLLLLCCLLLGALFGQFLFQERNRLAASKPELAPWLLSFCVALDCTLAPLRQKESIIVDNATFSKIANDAYRLTFTVKNTAAIPLATPSIELTLTDTGDQPVLRRVFLPSELGATSDALAGGSEWPVTLGMVVKAADLTAPVAGYRLLAFYL